MIRGIFLAVATSGFLLSTTAVSARPDGWGPPILNGVRLNGFKWNGWRYNGTQWNGFRYNGYRWNAVAAHAPNAVPRAGAATRLVAKGGKLVLVTD